jgi:hypothetical protein
MSREYEMICKTCKFWAPNKGDYWIDEKQPGPIAECHRYPPTLLNYTHDYLKRWEHIRTDKDNWCGEWQQINLPDGSRE